MKKTFILLLLFTMACGSLNRSITLEEMNAAQRNQTLQNVSKETILRFYPSLLRDVTPSIIEVTPSSGRAAGKKLYRVTYYNDPRVGGTMDFTTQILIFADTGKPFAIMSGEGMGIDVDLYDSIQMARPPISKP